MLIYTFVFLFFLFLTYGLFLLASRKADARHERLHQRVMAALEGSNMALKNSSPSPERIRSVVTRLSTVSWRH